MRIQLTARLDPVQLRDPLSGQAGFPLKGLPSHKGGARVSTYFTPDWLVTLQGALCRPTAPVVIVSEQIQDCSQSRSDALIGGERPLAIDNVQDDVGIFARLQAITSPELG